VQLVASIADNRRRNHRVLIRIEKFLELLERGPLAKGAPHSSACYLVEPMSSLGIGDLWIRCTPSQRLQGFVVVDTEVEVCSCLDFAGHDEAHH
jgi:hypothetical protein